MSRSKIHRYHHCSRDIAVLHRSSDEQCMFWYISDIHPLMDVLCHSTSLHTWLAPPSRAVHSDTGTYSHLDLADSIRQCAPAW